VELLTTAKSCPNLQHLFIQFTDVFLDDPVNALKCNTSLKGFKNLASLELFHFYGEEPELIDNMATVLRDCPGLKRLGLGLSCEFDCDQIPEILVASGDCDFLEKLCLKYGTRSSPLALETLRLGHGMFVYKSKSPNTGNYLSKLVKFRDIKTLHIYNGLVHETDDWDFEPVPMQVQWNFFTECASLCQLSVTRLDKKLRRWLNTSVKSVEELLVTEHYSMYDNGLGNFDILELPQLSMLFTREMTISKHPNARGWRGINPESREQIRVDKHNITTLDRLPDNIANLTRLGMCIELENQWVSCLASEPHRL
jgi:hypothetical protein